MRVALVHDNLWQMGGAERVLLALRQIFPDAPVFTLGASDRVRAALGTADLRVSFLQRISARPDRLRGLAALFPVAIRSFDLRGYDLIMSSSWGFAKAAKAGPGAAHICYCHSPLNWAWAYPQYTHGERLSCLVRALGPAVARGFRWWDNVTAARVTQFMANSRWTALRIRQYYGRDSIIVPPPIDLGFWRPTRPKEDFGVVVSRLVPHKRVDVAIAAFGKTGRTLYVVGEGRKRAQLEAVAPPNVRFLGWQDDETVRDLLSAARITIIPGREDFGIVFLESLACGTPVVAYGAGGALEVVIDGETGQLVSSQDPTAFADAVEETAAWVRPWRALRESVTTYDLPCFRHRVSQIVRSVTGPPVSERDSRDSAGAANRCSSFQAHHWESTALQDRWDEGEARGGGR